MYSKKPSILACVTGQYDCDRIIETAAAIAEEQECELRVLSVLRPTEDYSIVTDVLEYLHRVSKANGADMTVIFSAYAPAAAAQFVNDNNVSRIVTGMHDGGNESFLVMFNRFAPDVSITMVAKDNIVYSIDIARAGAQAWNPETDEFTSIAHVETDLKQETGEYHVTFSTSNGLEVTRKIWVIDQRVVENKKANEAISAFNFFKTADEIAESQALDTDLKVWANAQAWKLDDEDENVELFVDYDFDPENLKQGIYKVTFSTTGREFKIHTTDYVEEGKEVGLTFNPEDIHVMEKMGF